MAYQGNLGGTFRKPDTTDGMGSATRLATSGPFLSYLAQDIYERSLLVQSGVVTGLAALGGVGKIRTEVPFFGSISPTEEIITSANNWGTSGAGHFTSQKIEDATQYATIIHRGFQYAADDLTTLGIGEDPLLHLRNQLSQAINKRFTGRFVNQMEGLFAVALAANSLDKSSGAPTADETNYLTASSVTEAKYLLGERGQSLTTLAVHPLVAAYMEQVGMLTFSTSALSAQGAVTWGGGGVGVSSTQVGTFAGLNVIVDSQVPSGLGGAGNAQGFACYLMGPGAVGQADQVGLQIETGRNISSLQTELVCHYHHSYHVLGTSWAASTDNPDNTALALGSNWSLAYTGNDGHKLVPCVRLVVNSPFGGVNP